MANSFITHLKMYWFWILMVPLQHVTDYFPITTHAVVFHSLYLSFFLFIRAKNFLNCISTCCWFSCVTYTAVAVNALQPWRLTSDPLQHYLLSNSQSVKRWDVHYRLCSVGPSERARAIIVCTLCFFSLLLSLLKGKSWHFLFCYIEHEFEEFFYMWVCTLPVHRRWRRMTIITTMSMMMMMMTMLMMTFLKDPSKTSNHVTIFYRKAMLNYLRAKGRKKWVRANAIDLSVVWMVIGHVNWTAENVECHTWQVARLCPSAKMEMRWITDRT